MAQSLSGKLVLMQADLLKPDSFDDAVSGCEYVFHTASPFYVPDANAAAERKWKKN